MIGMGTKNILVSATGKRVESSRWECAVCKEGFWMTSKFIDHMATTNHYILLCNICNKGFNDQRDLDEHYLSNHNEVINVYMCKECPRKFSQKTHLEQHMQFHLQPVSVHQPLEEECDPVIKKYSNDITDNEIEEDEEYYVSFEEKVVNKFKKTRSGRVVKAKKRFENDVTEAKHRHRRQSKDSSASDDNKLNSNVQPKVVYNIQPATCENFLNKQLYVVTKKLPDSLYEKYMRNECIFTSSLVVEEKNIEIPSPDNTEFGLNKINSVEVHDSKEDKEKEIIQPMKSTEHNNAKKTDISLMKPSKRSKRLSIKSLKINCMKSKLSSSTINPDHLNIMADLDKIRSPLKLDEQNMQCMKINSENAANALQNEKLPEQSNQDISMNSINTKETAYSKKSNELFTSLIVTDNEKILKQSNYSNKKSPVTTKQSPTKKISELLKQKQNKLDMSKSIISPSVTIAKGLIKTSPSTARVEQRFLYVGPKQNFGEIQTAILEMKSQAKQNEDTKSVTAKKNNCVLSSSAPKPTSINVSNTAKQLTHSNSKNSNHDLNVNELCKKYPLHGKDGVLDKKFVKDFLIVKVTPELMQEVQQKALSDTHPDTNSENITKFHSSNSSQGAGLSKGADLMNKSGTGITMTEAKGKSVKTALITKKCIIPHSESFSDTCSDTIVECAKVEKRKLTNEIPLAQNNSVEYYASVSDELVIKRLKKELVDAKIKEKEHKKKKKYLLKQRMRHLEQCQSMKDSIFTNTVQNIHQNEVTNSVASEVPSLITKKQNKVLKVIEEETSQRLKKNTKLQISDKCSKFKQFNEGDLSDKDVYSKGFNIEDHISMYLKVASSFIKTVDITDTNSSQTNVNSGNCENADEKIIQKISELCLKFQKTRNEMKYLAYLNELDNLLTPDISKKCSFILDILRYCRLYPESYDVKERALSILNKIS